jgi:ATP-dependent DNA helicase RecQ
VLIAEPPRRQPRDQNRRRAGDAAPNPVGDPLFDALRARRKDLASQQGVPAYVIFHDSVLRAITTERPTTLEALGTIPGVGAKKLENYGEAFVEVVRGFG